jgi:ketosteroid isomerase-like protein
MIRKNFLSIFSFALLLISCNEIETSTHSNDTAVRDVELEKELRPVVFKVWEDANNSNISALKSAHLNSLKFSKFGPRIAERQDVGQTNKSETEHFLSIRDANLVIEDLKIDIFDKVGVATFYNNYSFIKNNAKIKGKGRVTLVFVRTEEGWKIVHEHSSPFINEN